MKKTVKLEKTKRIIYSAVALSLCIVALYSFWSWNKNNNDISPDVTDSYSETTINAVDDIQANTPVTNIPDDREDVSATTTEPLTVFYSFPLGDSIAKNFSNNELVKNSTTGDWRTHNGADIKGKSGDRVNAISDGTVISLSHDALWGTVVEIDHHNGVTAKYCGLRKGSTVKPGDDVKANDKVGLLDTIPIESDDGTHLHIEITKDGALVSPTDYLGKDIAING